MAPCFYPYVLCLHQLTIVQSCSRISLTRRSKVYGISQQRPELIMFGWFFLAGTSGAHICRECTIFLVPCMTSCSDCICSLITRGTDVNLIGSLSFTQLVAAASHLVSAN
ncbi:hypothetical protein MLD38_029561 [Melastoma candidum]|uniref:Uncharacterized protein n=1 Tax=Melastoma candidum TaxID=119954 RepID=A0ACB9N9T7_9MYRT|nr:hypothetical protein MLD38_029561 [Melastoma candidum]